MARLNASTYLGIISFNILLMAITCERVKEKMYENINGAFCFKRLNGTNEFGCTSSRSGNTGVLHIMKEKNDLDWLIQEAKAAPYVVMLPFDFPDFAEALIQLKDSGKVSGMILTANKTYFSPDDNCPNRYSGLFQSQCYHDPWNSIGSSLLFINFAFPIMYIDANKYPKDFEFLNQCFIKHNAHDMDTQDSRALCAVELTSHMLAAVDSQTCIRRSTMINNLTPMRYCDPLLGLNIHLPLFPRPVTSESVKKKRSVILVVTRLDGTSMFDGLVPGAGSPILGIVSLLTVAHVLSNLTEGRKAPERNVIFVFYHGESYDYIGSSRMIYDMENNAFPHRLQPDVEEQSDLLELDDIELVVELDQVSRGEIFYHSLTEISDSSTMAYTFLDELKKELNSLSLNLTASLGRLPPASVQRFLKKDIQINGIVLSSYDSTFDNKFYHSIFDDGKNLNFTYFNKTEPGRECIQRYIADFSLAVARALYSTIFTTFDWFNFLESKTKYSDSNLMTLVDELLHCYIESPACELFENVTFHKALDNNPYPVYVGVVKNNNVTTLTSLTLVWLTGSRVPRNRSACHNNDSDLLRQYFWMVGNGDDGVCVESYMNYSIAQSPAFDIQDYDWTSHEYSTWTESVWHEKMSARVFIKPSKKQEILTLSVGLLVFALSFVIIYFLNMKAEILFNQQVLESGGC